MSEIEYNNLTYEIAQALDRGQSRAETLNRLKHLCKHKIPAPRLGDIRNPNELLAELEKEGALGRFKLDFLKELLRMVKKTTWIQKVEAFQYRTSSSTVKWVAEKLLGGNDYYDFMI